MFEWLKEEKNQKMLWGYTFILPAILYFAIMNIYPLFYSFFLSFHKWNILTPDRKFVFLKNYIDLLSDPIFLRSVLNTFLYVIVIVPISIAISLFFAVLLNSGIKFIGLFRLMYFIPVITSGIAVTYIWKWLYDPTFGLFNNILSAFKIQCPFLASPYTALLSISLMIIWKSIGFQIVILLTALTSIPKSVYEAAEMDGVTGWKRFRYITLPLLKPTMLFLAVTGTISTLQLFGPVFVASPTGGPLNSTSTMVFHIQQTAFTSYRVGYASAMTLILFAIIMIITFIQMKFLSKGVKN